MRVRPTSHVQAGRALDAAGAGVRQAVVQALVARTRALVGEEASFYDTFYLLINTINMHTDVLENKDKSYM